MEQKTEASQAVDEKAALVAVGEKMAKWLAALARSPLAYDSWIDTCRDLSMQWDATLKAQPAPTEAAQAESPFKFRPWSKEAEMMEGWTAAEKAREAAQGEDSARLDAALLKAREWIVKNRPALTLSRAKTIDEYMGLLDTIDRARASAETGGVKP